jgi:hypothetical protein
MCTADATTCVRPCNDSPVAAGEPRTTERSDGGDLASSVNHRPCPSIPCHSPMAELDDKAVEQGRSKVEAESWAACAGAAVDGHAISPAGATEALG